MEKPEYRNEIELMVRDYECDLQGVVNNANYLHYLEHARHQWLLSLGVDFEALHREGIDLIVVRIEIDYRSSLRSGDRFVVRSTMEREGRLRLVLRQDIYRIRDGKLVAEARVGATGIQNGRPTLPDSVMERLQSVLTGS